MKLKILCISLGSIGKRHLRNTRELLPDAEIAVYRQHTKDSGEAPEGADRTFSSLDEAVAYTPHAVIVSSPASEHIKNSLPFIQNNIPVFMEKPLAEKSDGLEEFAQACKQSTGFTMVGYVLRFLPALHAIKKLLLDGTLGDVYTAHIEVGQYLPDWRESDYREGVSAQKKLGGGALLELSHEIDYATWLFGWPKSLQCSRARLSPLEIDVEDSAHIIMEYEHTNVLLKLDFLQRVANMAIQLVGEKGTLEGDMMTEELWLMTPEEPDGIELVFDKLQDGNDIYLRQFDFFFSHALPGYKERYPDLSKFTEWATVDHAAGVIQIVDLAKKASDVGARQPVHISAKAAT